MDTGSAVTSIASELQWPAAATGGHTGLTGASGSVTGKRLASVSLEMEREPVSLDLGNLSRLNGMKVAGILGYSVLSRGPVMINYRDRQVEIAGR